MIKKMISTLCAMIFCLGLLPIAAYAVEGRGHTEGTVASTPTTLAAMPDGQVLYVGGVSISFTGYWTTDSEGNVAAYTGAGAPADSYIHYDESTNTLTLHNATIKRELALNPDIPGGTIIAGAAIGVLNQSGNAELTIQLEGGNTIEDVSTGINVLATSSSIGTARLTITGSGSLIASGNADEIRVQSNSNDATLDIQDTVVEATVDSSAGLGVMVKADNGKSASLTVEGGSLIASGRKGILFPEGNPSLNVSDSAIVRASGGIASDDSSETGPVTTGGTGGVVFNGDEGTVYGSVTLQEDLTIDEGENLDIPNGASLTIPSGTTLTNEGTVTNSGALTNNGTINNFGTLPDNIQGTAPPSITATSLDDGAENAAYTATLAADGEPTSWTWSADTNSSLPPGLALSTSGVISGTPTTQGTYNFTVTATNSGGSDSKSLSITINPAANVPVESVSLNHTELSLTEGDIDTLTATVEPSSATNKDVTWSSDNPSVATVNNGVVTAVSEGTANITVTTKDGNKTATCEVTVLAKTYNISVTPATLDFGSATDGYTKAPEEQTVTITNTGNQSVTVDLPTSTNYIITAGAGFANGTATIAPNSTAQFTVQPKTGLAIGTYNETITVSGSNGASTSLNANFTVSAVPATDDTSPIKETPENTASTNDNQVLPQTSDNNFLFMTVLCLISLVSLISGLIALRNLKRVK